MQTIYIVNISVLSILVFLLSIKTKKNHADKYLIAFFITIIIGVLNDVLAIMLPQYESFFSFGGIAVPLGAAFIFLYVDALISDKDLSSHYLPLIFLPSAIVLIFLIFNPEYEIISSNNTLLIIGYFLFKIGMPLAFIVISSYRLKQYKKGLKNEFSYIENIDLKWLKVFIDSGLFLLTLAFISFILFKFKVIFSIDILVIFTNVSLFIFILFLAYYGIKNTYTFRDIITERNIEPKGNSSLCEKTDIADVVNEHADNEFVEKLESVIESEKPYLAEKLTVAELSEQTKIPTRQLSQILNKQYNQNFFDYINTLRIHEFNRRKKQGVNQQFTILSIAYECGFSSKSAFNRAYKKHLGVPPSSYAKSGTSL
jgi:AraC-like DNA-binding protein